MWVERLFETGVYVIPRRNGKRIQYRVFRGKQDPIGTIPGWWWKANKLDEVMLEKTKSFKNADDRTYLEISRRAVQGMRKNTRIARAYRRFMKNQNSAEKE